jgi:hypothetical protein
MQAAADPIVVEVPAGGDDLGLDGEVAGSFYFAEIRRPARTHQGLQPPLPLGTHDLHLKIAAAGSSPKIIRSPAGGEGARVSGAEYGKAVGRQRKRPNCGSAVLHDHKAIAIQSAGLFGPVGSPGNRPLETVGGTLSRGALVMQISAGNPQHRVHVQLALILPEVVKRDVLSVSDEPGGLMVEGGSAFLQWTDPKCYGNSPALGAQSATGRSKWLVTHAHPGGEKSLRSPKLIPPAAAGVIDCGPSSVWYSSAYSERVHKVLQLS